MDKEPAYNWTKSTHTKLHHGGTRNPYKILKALFKYIYHNDISYFFFNWENLFERSLTIREYIYHKRIFHTSKRSLVYNKSFL